MTKWFFPVVLCVYVNAIAFAEYDWIPYFKGANVLTYAPELGKQGKKEFNLEEAKKSLARLRKDGVDYIEIVLRGKVRYPADLQIKLDPTGLSDEQLHQLIGAARKTGIIPILKPHLIMAWWGFNRSEIGESWGREDKSIERKWFLAYQNYIMHYVKISSEEKLPFFVIATELPLLAVDRPDTGTRREDAWRDLIKEIRKNYDGKLTYAANSISAAAIKWWDALDYIGVDGYFTLTKEDNPSAEAIKDGWLKNGIQRTRNSFGKVGSKRQEEVNIVDELESLSNKFGKPVVFTEIGYRSADGAAWHVVDGDWNWYNQPENQKLQADLYRAMFKVFRQKPWFKGFFFWSWYLGRADADKLGYRISHMVEGKKAEAVIHEEYVMVK